MRETMALTPIPPYEPCPCQSGKKYKWCCLPLHREAIEALNHPIPVEVDDLDDLSNSVLDLIQQGRLDEAEQICHDLATRYPDQIDAIERLAAVERARGNHSLAASLWRKAACWAMAMPGFEDATEDYYDQAKEADTAAQTSSNR